MNKPKCWRCKGRGQVPDPSYTGRDPSMVPCPTCEGSGESDKPRPVATPFTAGPWEIDNWRNGFTSKVAIQGPSFDSRGTVPVCWIEANRIAAENEANARLICAAPDLLAVVEFALAKFCDPLNCDDDPAAAKLKEIGEAAVAKAKGS